MFDFFKRKAKPHAAANDESKPLRVELSTLSPSIPKARLSPSMT